MARPVMRSWLCHGGSRVTRHFARVLWACAASVGLLLLPVGGARALLTLSCDPLDAVANTANVLCAGASVCTGTSVALKENVDIPVGGCTFDLGGRTLSIEKTLQASGAGFLTVMNAGNIAMTATGRLKARGDSFQNKICVGGANVNVQCTRDSECPGAVCNTLIIRGGLVSLTSAGTITLPDRAQIDVSGDAAGLIRLVAGGADVAGVGVDLQTGAVLQGLGISSFTDAGERFADGGTLDVTASVGSITDNATINMSGANQAMGGDVTMRAARNLTVGELMDVSGGGGDGGNVDLLAGDDITISKTITVESRTGGGYGGTITLAAGEDSIGGVAVGGGLTVDINRGPLKLDGSVSDTTGGDGGDLDASARGTLQFVGLGTAVSANAGTTFDGYGGTITLDSSDGNMSVIGPLDGNLVVNGKIVATSGSTAGDGGIFDATAGRNLVLNGDLVLNGKDTGGDVTGFAGGTVSLNGLIDAHATTATGVGGYVDFAAGEARGEGTAGQLTVAQDIWAAGGSASSSGQTISLAGCTLAVNTSVKIDGSGGVDALLKPGGSDIELIARHPMQLQANSQYLAAPGGSIRLTHPPGQAPVIGAGVVFDPAAIDNATTAAFYPNCPVCGDGIRQFGEVCDKGAGADGSCCNADCTAFTCVTPTPTPTLTATPPRTSTPALTATLTPVPTLTPTPTVTIAATLATTTTMPTPTPSLTGTPTPIRTSTVTSTPVATVTVSPTATPSVIPTPTGTVTSTPVATATATSAPTVTTTATSAPTVAVTSTATATMTASVTATPFAIPTPTITPTPSQSPTPSHTPTPTVTPTPAETPTLTVASTDTSTPAPTATPPEILDTAAAKAADKCAKAITKIGSTLIATKLKSLDKCANGVLKCVQIVPDEPAKQECIDSAGAKCTAQLQKIASAAGKLKEGLAKACGLPVLSSDLLRRGSGLGYGRLAAECQSSLDDISMVSDCLIRQHGCQAEKLFEVDEPRAGELLALAHVDLGQVPCLDRFDGGGDVGDPKTLGKTVVQCQAAIKRAAARFATSRQKSLGKCVGTIFSCVQTKPNLSDPSGAGPCLTLSKAKDTCVKELAKLDGEGANLDAAVDKKCVLAGIDLYAVLSQPNGAHLGAPTAECALFGVASLDTFASYKQCLRQQHVCRAAELMRFEAPRATELLESLGDPSLTLHSDLCPAPASP